MDINEIVIVFTYIISLITAKSQLYFNEKIDGRIILKEFAKNEIPHKEKKTRNETI